MAQEYVSDEAWKWNKSKKKTDKRNARKLAMMYSYGRYALGLIWAALLKRNKVHDSG